VIELGLAPYIERSLKEAAEAGAAFVVLDMDTPGGRRVWASTSNRYRVDFQQWMASAKSQ
jgi:hypothetical protein